MGTTTTRVVVIKLKRGRGDVVRCSYLSDVVGKDRKPRFTEELTRAIGFRSVEEGVEVVKRLGWATEGPGWRLHVAAR